MYALLESLMACGYEGACMDIQILTWAVRVGACSFFFNDLLAWLEYELDRARCTTLVRENIRNLFKQMHSSILMRPCAADAPETVLNPREYRLQTLKVLLHQLVLSRRTEMCDQDDPTRSQLNLTDVYGDLRVTLNTEKLSCGRGWSERSVRYNPNLLQMYE